MPEKLDKDIVFKAAEALVIEVGCELVDVEIKKSSDKVVLGLIIDKKDGVTIEDCEAVTKLVDPQLDKQKDIAGKYDYFTVSSAGIDRPFKTTQDYINHIGEKIEVKLYSAVEKKKFFQLLLREANDEYIVLQYKNKSLKILRSNITKANIAIEF